MPRTPTFNEADIAKAKPGTLVHVKDVPNLYMITSEVKGNHRWHFRIMHNGKIVTKSLGTYPDVPLDWAINSANYIRRALKVDKRKPEDVFTEDRDAVDAGARTFGDTVSKYLENNQSSWKPKQFHDIKYLLEVHAKALWDKPILRLHKEHIADAIRPLWDEKPKQANRVAKRIAIVFDYGIDRRWYSAANPARKLKNLLPKRTIEEINFDAMDYELVPQFIKVLRRYQDRRVAPVALEFLILTACRTDEVLGMKWSEVEGNVWTVLGERTKTGRPHRVPLVGRTLEILKRQEGNGSDYVFPGRESDRKRGKPMNNKVMRDFLYKMQKIDPTFDDATVHGFRSSFRDWCASHGDFGDFAAAERCLAHVRAKTVRAYQRDDLLEKRTEIMTTWSDYCCG
jgi:integrase